MVGGFRKNMDQRGGESLGRVDRVRGFWGVNFSFANRVFMWRQYSRVGCLGQLSCLLST